MTGFDDPSLLAAMRSYLDACTAVEAAADDAQVLALADAKVLAGMRLRKCLVAQGWTAPVSQRTTT